MDSNKPEKYKISKRIKKYKGKTQQTMQKRYLERGGIRNER